MWCQTAFSAQAYKEHGSAIKDLAQAKPHRIAMQDINVTCSHVSIICLLSVSLPGRRSSSEAALIGPSKLGVGTGAMRAPTVIALAIRLSIHLHPSCKPSAIEHKPRAEYQIQNVFCSYFVQILYMPQVIDDAMSRASSADMSARNRKQVITFDKLSDMRALQEQLSLKACAVNSIVSACTARNTTTPVHRLLSVMQSAFCS